MFILANKLILSKIAVFVICAVFVFPVFAKLVNLPEKISSAKTAFHEIVAYSDPSTEFASQQEYFDNIIRSVKNTGHVTRNTYHVTQDTDHVTQDMNQEEDSIKYSVLSSKDDNTDHVTRNTYHVTQDTYQEEGVPSLNSRFQIPDSTSGSVLGTSISTSSFIESFRQSISQGLPDDILAYFRGPRGEKGDKGDSTYVSGPVQYSIGYTVPSAQTPATLMGASSIGAKEINTSNLTVTNQLTTNSLTTASFGGSVSFGGNITIGDTSTDTITLNAQVSSHIIPAEDDIYDLGSVTNRFRNVYVGPGTIHVICDSSQCSSAQEYQLSVDSTTGRFQITDDSDTTFFTVDPSGKSIASKQLQAISAPTLAHTFSSFPAGTSNVADSSLYINPSTAVADSNLLGIAVNGGVKFLVDAEGDIYGNNLILTGSTTTGTTDIAGSLTVGDNTTLGDASSDLLTINSTAVSIPNNLNIDSSTFYIDSTSNNVGIGTTNPGALIHGIKTTEQLRLGYDSSNYNSFTVGSTGSLTIAATGTNPNITFTPAGTGNVVVGGNRNIVFDQAFTNTGIGIYSHSNTYYPSLVWMNSANKTRLTGYQGIELATYGPKIEVIVAQGYVDFYGQLYTNGANYEGLRITPATGSMTLSAITTGTGADNINIVITPAGTGYTILNGNVGIGTTAPGVKLTIGGTYPTIATDTSDGADNKALQLGGGGALVAGYTDSTRGAILNLYGNEKGTASYNGRVSVIAGDVFTSGLDGAVVFQTHGIDRMAIDFAGNVGIGTTAPISKLEVSAASAAEIRINSTNNGNAAALKVTYGDFDNHGLHLSYLGSSATATIQNTYPVTSGQLWGDTYFASNNGGSIQTNLTIKGYSGNVGIGTTSPMVKLHVAIPYGRTDTTERNIFALLSNDTDFPSGLNVSLTGAVLQADRTVSIQTMVKNSDGTTNQSAGRLALQPNGGNVGIGTTSPLAKLYISDTQSTVYSGTSIHTPVQTIYNASSVDGSGTALRLQNGDGSVAQLVAISTGTDFQTAFAIQMRTAVGTYAERLRIDNLGNVGIGTTDVRSLLSLYSASPSIRWNDSAVGVAAPLLEIYTANGGTWATRGAIFKSTVGGTPTDILSIINGNVGIGTTSPGARLDVKGAGTGPNVLAGTWGSNTAWSMLTFGNTTTGANFYSDGATRLVINRPTGQILSFREENGTDQMTILPTNGNVGIGTTSPGAKLEISKGSIGDYLIVGGDSASNVRALKFTSGTITNVGDLHTLTAQSNTGVIAFANGNVGETVRINKDGNVGIGTMSPGSKLSVIDSINTDITIADFRTKGDAGATQGKTYIGLSQWNSGTYPSVRIGAEEDGLGSADASLVFQTRNNSSDVVPSTRMVIDKNGNVGIGTTAPASKLEIGSGQILVPDAGYGAPALSFSNDTDTGLYRIAANDVGLSVGGATNMLRVTATQIQTYAGGSASIPAWTDNSDTTTGLFYPATNTVAFSTGGTEALRITGGNVGIGTTSPTVNLNVWGVRAAQKTLLQLETDSSGGATNDENSIDFKYYNGYEQGRISSYVYNNATGNGGLKFYTSLTGTSYNSTPNMTLDPNGNVGIGTTGPRYKNTTIGVISSLLSDDGTNYEGLTITPATGYSTISTVTGGSGTANLNINLVTSGTGGVGINALSGSLPNHKPQLYVYKNANTSNIVTVANVASGSAAYSGIYASVDSTLTNAAGLLALSAGYTTSGMFVANTGAIYSSMPGGLNIGSYANTQVSIWTNNLQRLTVLNDGNVGIGTTGPTSKLSVVGDVDITGSYLINGSPFSGSSQWVTTGSNIYYTTGNVGIGTTNPGSKLAVSVPGAVAGDVDPIITGQYSDINFGLYSVATAITDPKAFGLALKTYKQNIGLYEAIRITHDGNVGIGTTTPGANLEVVDTVRVGSDGDIGADTEFANLDFYSNDLSTGAQKTAGAIRLKSGSTNWQSSASPAYHDASMLFYTISDGTFSEKLRIQDVGNVGIGTTIPSSRLEIKESTAGSLPVLRLIASDDGLVSVVGKDAQEDFYLYGYDGTGNVDIQFRAGGDVSYINSGNVGIGTTGPSSYLAGVFGLSVYGATNSGVSVATSNGYWMWYMPNGGTDLRLYNGVGGDRLTVLSSGNVGIGTTNPSSFQLQITGNGGKPGGGSWGDTSDARLKTDVVSITNALDKITQLNPVHFTWINPSEHGNMYGIQGGFIAQELESVFPQWVKEGTPSGLDNLLVNGDIVKTINLPFEFDAYVVAAIQELNNQLNIYIDENQVLRIKDQGEGVGIIVSNIKSIASISGKWSIDEGGNVIAKTVTVEEGFNMKDQVTGQYYCVTLRNGEFDKQPGKCGEAVAPTAPTEEAVPEEVGGSTVETTEQTTQEPVEEIIESQPEAVVESEETSSEEVIVETTEEEVLPAGAETQEPTEGESEGTTLE